MFHKVCKDAPEETCPLIARLATLLQKVCNLGPQHPWSGGAPGAPGVVERLASNFDRVRRQELERRMAREALAPEEAERLERFSHELVARLLHSPGQRLPQLMAAGLDPSELADALDLLGLGGSQPTLERSA